MFSEIFFVNVLCFYLILFIYLFIYLITCHYKIFRKTLENLYLKTNKHKVAAWCGNATCPLHIHAYIVELGPQFHVQTYNSNHSCSKLMIGWHKKKQQHPWSQNLPNIGFDLIICTHQMKSYLTFKWSSGWLWIKGRPIEDKRLQCTKYEVHLMVFSNSSSLLHGIKNDKFWNNRSRHWILPFILEASESHKWGTSTR